MQASLAPRQGCCRHCGMPLTHTFVDLGMSPLSNAYVQPEHLRGMEPFFPLHVYVCGSCFLVPGGEFETPEAIFSDYAYFSSYSDSWLEHCRRYVQMIIARLGLAQRSKVVEIASNDGYLLQYFVVAKIPCLGIEPAANVAEVARRNGIPTEVCFFGSETAQRLKHEGHAADLLLGNNVLAHVPDINDFVRGLAILLKDDGVVTMEFPHLLQLMQHTQFDTIYHEHFSYLSILAVEHVFQAQGLRLFDIEQLPTHGGSVRIYACHQSDPRPEEAGLIEIRREEAAAGLDRLATYAGFEQKTQKVKRDLLSFLIEARNQGQRVVGYGAAAKGTTLLNYCGIRQDLLDYVVDRSPHKQGRYIPGVHVPICDPQRVFETRPDYVVILPWNLREEIGRQMSGIREWGARFVVAVPQLEVFQ
jgi:SAM-dependent methyltransferase